MSCRQKIILSGVSVYPRKCDTCGFGPCTDGMRPVETYDSDVLSDMVLDLTGNKTFNPTVDYPVTKHEVE